MSGAVWAEYEGLCDRITALEAENKRLRRAIVGLVNEWGAYIGQGDEDGHDDPVLVGTRIAALVAALEGSE